MSKSFRMVTVLSASSGASEVFRPSLFQPQPSVVSGQGNPKIWCVVRGAPARAHVLSWYQQLMGKGPTFLLSQREGAPPAYGSGVNPRFLAEIDPTRNAACLTVGNASPADEGTYYCAVWYSGQFIFGEGTRLLYQGESEGVGPSIRCAELQWSGWQWAWGEGCREKTLQGSRGGRGGAELRGWRRLLVASDILPFIPHSGDATSSPATPAEPVHPALWPSLPSTLCGPRTPPWPSEGLLGSKRPTPRGGGLHWGSWGSHSQLAAAASGGGRDVCDLPRPAPEWGLGCCAAPAVGPRWVQRTWCIDYPWDPAGPERHCVCGHAPWLCLCLRVKPALGLCSVCSDTVRPATWEVLTSTLLLPAAVFSGG